MVTCIDITSLYKEKRGKAVYIVDFLSQVKHDHITYIYGYQIVEDKFIFVEMEAPFITKEWKTFCKKKFSPEELLDILAQFSEGVEFLHSLNFIHRDVHPSRIQQFEGGKIKFNPIGLPYNFKKLLKRDNFSGHINYSPPELILENNEFTTKVDAWAVGCCLYYLIMKKDPFDGKDPKQIKQNIMNLCYDENAFKNIPEQLKLILDYIFVGSDVERPSVTQIIKFLRECQQQN